jgi:hypothetical protein
MVNHEGMTYFRKRHSALLKGCGKWFDVSSITDMGRKVKTVDHSHVKCLKYKSEKYRLASSNKEGIETAKKWLMYKRPMSPKKKAMSPKKASAKKASAKKTMAKKTMPKMTLHERVERKDSM